MGLFGKIFEKKECAVCGAKIGLLGNNKLADANMCDDCAGKLSPWFQNTRESTLEQILEQLEYREANKEKLKDFNATRILSEKVKIYLDEDKGQFVVSKKKNFKDENPDVIDFSQIIGVEVDVDENWNEEQRLNEDGDFVSYDPPRYKYTYDFYIVIRVKHPYFEEMRFQLNDFYVEVEQTGGRLFSGNNRENDPKVRKYQRMGEEIKQVLTEARKEARAAKKTAAAAPKPVKCPWCGTATMPAANGCCEHCGGSLNG